MTKRFQRLPLSPALGHYFVFGPRHWKEIERAYGHKLPSRARKWLSLATIFLTTKLPAQWASPIINTKSRDSITQKLSELANLAEEVREDFFHRMNWAHEYRQASAPKGFVSRLHLQLEEIDNADEGAQDKEFPVLLACLGGVIDSSVTIISKIKEDRYAFLLDGMIWDRWVVLVTLILEAHSLPTGTRADVYRVRKSGTPNSSPSPFVNIIDILETITLPGYRRSSTPGGRAKAIARARNAIKVPSAIRIDNKNIDPSELEKLLLAAAGVGSESPTQGYDLIVGEVLSGKSPGLHPLEPDPFYTPLE